MAAANGIEIISILEWIVKMAGWSIGRQSQSVKQLTQTESVNCFNAIAVPPDSVQVGESVK